MYVTARANRGPADGRGVIGYAWSHDLRSWQTEAPVSEPGEFAQLEVPQLAKVGDRWRMLFCAWSTDHSAARRARGVIPESGTHYLNADSPQGPFIVADGPFLLGDPVGPHYGGRLLHHAGRWWFFAWHNFDEHGDFVGALSDPIPLEVDGDMLRAKGGTRVATGRTP